METKEIINQFIYEGEYLYAHEPTNEKKEVDWSMGKLGEVMIKVVTPRGTRAEVKLSLSHEKYAELMDRLPLTPKHVWIKVGGYADDYTYKTKSDKHRWKSLQIVEDIYHIEEMNA